MKAAYVDSQIKVEIRDVPIPKPGLGQILIQVVVTGTNPKDWKYPQWLGGEPSNQGDDIAGHVAAVGDGVVGFVKGDRVGAFHRMHSPDGSYAEFAIAWDYTTFHLPTNISFEEAATIPLAGLTAGLGLYQQLDLPLPFRPATSPTPLVVYGGSSAVGAFVIKLARASNIHPIIAVAGRASTYVERLIDRSRGDTIIDYRQGDEAVVKGIKDALGGKELKHAFDATSEGNTTLNINKVLAKGGAITTVLDVDLGDNVDIRKTMVSSVHDPDPKPTGVGKTVGARDGDENLGASLGDAEFAAAFFSLVTRGLAHGWFTPHPYEVVAGGLNGLELALNNLHAGKTSAFKYVLRVADTQGAGEDRSGP